MQKKLPFTWVRIGLFNLFIVACYGVLMRYKIAFEFPFFDQKNLLHAHSHFAFSGWISFVLMVLIVNTMNNVMDRTLEKRFNRVLAASLVFAYGMLFSFTIKGYWFVSIFFATASVLTSFIFGWLYFTAGRKNPHSICRKWFLAAIAFNVLSAFGTFYLGYMMAAKHINQHYYLASVYWYLHFQYNGYFLFAAIGLLLHYLGSKGIETGDEKIVFRSLLFSCLPAFGLSVLWLRLPGWVYCFVVLASVLQFFGWAKLLAALFRAKLFSRLKVSSAVKYLFICSAIAMSVKILLQTGSTIPAVSRLAFGFRPIVIAYLHLVLLGIFTLFLAGYLFATGIIQNSPTTRLGITGLLAGVAFNETLLAVQGIFSFSYTVLPYINELLLVAAIILAVSVLLVLLAQLRKAGAC